MANENRIGDAIIYGASSCCWLPLVLLAAGVTGAGIAAALEAYRPLFVVVTFGFLAAKSVLSAEQAERLGLSLASQRVIVGSDDGAGYD